MELEWRFVHRAKRRWYKVRVQKDLFGQVVILCLWGSLDSRLGGKRCEPYARERLLAILKRRQKRKYEAV